MKLSLVKSFVLALLLMVSGVLAHELKPTRKMSTIGGPMNFEHMVPTHFGDWKEVPMRKDFVKSEAEKFADQVYTLNTAKTYVNTATGQQIVLVLAYGEDQRDAAPIHYPEVCYPAQGYRIDAIQNGSIDLGSMTIPVRRLEAMSPEWKVYQPTTYWTLIGDRVVSGRFQSKISQIRLGLRGLIPDGLLFRVSSFDPDSTRAFALHESFAKAFVSAMPPETRRRFVGTPHS